MQQWLIKLAVPSLDALIGRTDLLQLLEGETSKQSHLDLSSIIQAAARPETGAPHYQHNRNHPYDKGKLNQQILADYKADDISGKVYAINNYDRSVGAKISGHLAQKFGQKDGRKGSALTVNFKGIAGQSFGVWNHQGVYLNLQGDANDYVGKGMSGGSIAVFPPDNISYVPSRGAIIGNTCLYGASGGFLYAAGQAGERFAVRNSGATAVVEGVGDHGCEYMTGGTVVILGPVGENFGAGMTGGAAFVFDDFDILENKINAETIEVVFLVDAEDEALQEQLRQLLQNHIENTQSRWAQKIDKNFESYVDAFKYVRPKTSQKLVLQAPPMYIKGQAS